MSEYKDGWYDGYHRAPLYTELVIGDRYDEGYRDGANHRDEVDAARSDARPTYHRNGESEPPTVEGGYWIYLEVDDHTYWNVMWWEPYHSIMHGKPLGFYGPIPMPKGVAK